MRFLNVLSSTFAISLSLLTVEVVLRPPTDREVALLGPGASRAELAQARLAHMIVAVNADQGAWALSTITGVEVDVVRDNLHRIARHEARIAAEPEPEPAEPLPRIRDMPNGGARFVSVN